MGEPLLDEQDLLSLIETGLYATPDTPELRDMDTKRLPTENAAFLVILLDGAKFVVSVTKIEEGE